MEDIKITCKDCGKEFVWTVGEQEYYKAHGLENQPKRCGECRKARKAKVHNNFEQEQSEKPAEVADDKKDE